MSTDQKDVPPEFWGMHVASPIGESFPDAPITAVNLTSSGVYWHHIETAPGVRDFTRLDSVVATSEQRDSRPLLVLGPTPSFHSTDPGAEQPAATVPERSAWEAHVRAVVNRYGAKIDYQIWPEPNIVSNWSGTPAEMATLTVQAARIINEVAPRAMVVSPATTLRQSGQRRWMDDFWDASWQGQSPGDVVDAVALDPFPLEDGTPEDSIDLLCRAQLILDEHGVDAPVWTNEINYGVPSGGHATDVQHVSPEVGAAWVARTYLLHSTMGVERVYWLGWGAYPGMSVALTAADFATPTPAADGFTTVHGWLADAARPECRVAEGVYTCTTEGEDRRLQIMWRGRGTSSVEAPDGARRVEQLDGTTIRVQPGEEVEVGSTPVAVVSN